ncbi:cyclase family protein [Marinomonas mediterranea]|uniref:Cyclase family protein n=1 Tax=Marinomonas mediterranea (strain ATCC 700492 / JCM 21426 / NBRC 103028 / MMB-1) TaxID=717774 RepID=F2JZE8_MARM1|nr:cyclase family protein [Marinomonas mediterranea]ADZ89731.1 cyclase family protein [Marinomonas mediterranea MMB-1]WCN07824.1 cyclase family protein [Marinomonas mediterranea]WCN11918.1 cyclase family protein [Marinomonas mediterranea]WCN15956.1 cyclase family protein [Marinomonas mediterranea MMB-1]
MFDALKNGILTGHKVIDLSVTLNNNPHTDPPPLRPKIKYTDHQEGLGSLLSMFPGLKAEDLPDAEGWAAEDLEITTHSGTHMDAPWHYASTTDGGKPAWGIDQLPLEWCFQRGVKLDFRHLPDGYVVSAKDIQEELARIGHELQPLDIVLVNTRAGAIYGEPEYLSAGVGIGREGTLFLLDQGVRVVGTDAWSWDAPFSYTAKRFQEEKDPSIVWEGHKAGRDIGYGQMEKLANLEALPAHGFLVSCFPYKIEKASAGFVRAVAIMNT